MAGQFIYTMHKVGKFIPPNRDVIKDITLSFFPGAKIGVLGPNGAGKSTLLKIMAGIDTDYTGEAKLGEGYTVGMLEQEPELDPTKTVLENVMDGAGDAAAMLARSVIDKSSLSSFCSIALDELRHDRLTELNLRDKNIGNND